MKAKYVKYEHNGKVHCEQYHFFCPGCKTIHAVGKSIHQFNSNFERPTFKPSILAIWSEFTVPDDPTTPAVDKRCHSFVTEGRIQFLTDCTHELRGQTVDLPEVPA